MSTVTEIRESAAKLPAGERAELAAFLLDSLEIEYHHVNGVDVKRRGAELNNGEVEGLSWGQVKSACGRS